MSEKKCKTYIPQKLPIDNKLIDWEAITPALGAANRSVSKYDGVLCVMQNPSLLLSPMIREEAVQSSKIEGTQVDTIDVMRLEAGAEFQSPAQEKDFQEVMNYRNSVRLGQAELSDRKLSLGLIKDLHSLLLQNVKDDRGAKCVSGTFRTTQNYIGDRSRGIENARFVPPDPIIVPELMDNFAQYLSSDGKDPLLQAAIMHAQFEIIHPFEDGNGRLGRMLTPLFLCQKGVISKPMFYISGYLESHSAEYKDSLLNITHGSGWTQWIIFFLTALKVQADENFKSARRILDYYDATKALILKSTGSQYSIPLLDSIIDAPIFKPSMIKFGSMPSRNTIHKLLGQFEKLGIVKVIIKGKGRAGLTYCAPELLNISEGEKLW